MNIQQHALLKIEGNCQCEFKFVLCGRNLLYIINFVMMFGRT